MHWMALAGNTLRTRAALVLVGTLLISGCASVGTEGKMSSFSESWANADYVTAGQSFGGIDITAATQEDIENLELFDLLHFAEAARLGGRPDLAVHAYDETELHFKRYDLESFASAAGSQVGAVLVNDNVMSYRGYLYEAVLANTYKGLSFLEMGDAEGALVEFNRAEERARRATHYFRESIAEQRKALNEEANDGQQQIVNASLRSSNTQQAILSEYGAPSRWSVYADFVNPFATYMHGLHRLASSSTSNDFEAVIPLLERVAGVTSNPVVVGDLELTETLAGGSRSATSLPPLIWVVFDNGIGPQLVEQRIDLPLAGVGDGSVFYAGIALPSITDGQPASRLLINTGGTGSVKTQPVASMKRIMNTEFQARFDGILLRSMTSAVVKVAAQAVAEEEFGAMGGLLAGIASAATTQADIRSWRALPDRWEVARVERPDSGMISLGGIQATPVRVNIPDWPMTMVYVKKTTRDAPVTVRVIDLSGRNEAMSPAGLEMVQGDLQ